MMIARQQTAFSAVQRRSVAPATGLHSTPLRSVVVRFKEGDDKSVGDQIKSGLKTVTNQLDQLDTTKQGPGKPMAELQKEVRSTANGQFSDQGPVVQPVESAFTRQREIWAGRAAIVGFFAACFWETVIPHHPGVLGQISHFTGLSNTASGIAIAAIIGWSAFTALRPGSPTYSQENRLDAAQRPLGAAANPDKVSLATPQTFLGISSWGFTKKNELFNGRLAMLGFTAAVAVEVATGGLGPLAQVARYIGATADDSYYHAVSSGFGVYAILAVALAYALGNTGFQADKESDIY